MLILVSFVVVAFLGRSTREAVLVGGTTGGQKAEILANSAAETIIADLKNEMRAGSTEIIVDGVAIMEPDTAVTAMPSQARLAATSGTVFDNLIKQSGATAGMFLNTAPYNKNSVTELIPAASTTKTTTASVDGRTVSATRWNAPQLLVGGNFGASTVPNWILMDRVGIAPSQTFNATNFTNRTPNNDRFIIGRFAYNIYDVSGLLDINVAGYPSGVTTADSARKGNLAMAALENIPGITSAANASLFVKDWRNKVTGTTATNFLSFLGLGNATANAYYNFGPKYGFQKVANSASDSDNRILSRQDLIKLATNGNFGISTAALPYLTHFSRAVSAPSWSPPTPTGSSINYNADRNSAGSANRFLPHVRVTAPFTRGADGTAAQQGEPLLKTRFPLSRLAGLGRTGVNTTSNTTMLAGVASKASAATVQRDFGLTWSSDRWIYAGPTGSSALSSIATLGSISGREPNFFELLKASILSGSLGRNLGVTQIDTNALDSNPDNQIIQIGVNLIDQYDADAFPTKIAFGGNDFAGIENIPYLTRIFSQFYRPTSDSTANRAYFMAEVWNPHQPKTNASGPTRFRFAAAGRSRFYVGSIEDPTKPYPNNPNPGLNGPSVAPNGQKSVLGFTLSRTSSSNPVFSPSAANSNFANPTLLIPVNGASATGNNNVSDGPVKFVGIYAGRLVCKADIEGTPAWEGNGPCYGGYLVGDPTLSFELQYENGTGNWVSYQIWNGHKWGGLWDGGCNRGPGDPVSPALYSGGMDPRSNRFGNMGNYDHYRSITLPYWNDQNYEDNLYKTLRPDSTKTQNTVWTSIPYGVPLYVYAPVPPAGWAPLTPGPDLGATAYRPGWLTENKDTLPTWYKDNDGILRNGDAAYASGAWGQPLEQANSAAGLASRPVILDRPFRSVAEMGYAFRDLPYKSLDFFTENSADAALLDVFSVNESPVTGVSAGVLNPNTRHQPVLKAVLANVLKNELDAASTLDTAVEADKIATKITTATVASPLRNPSDIATRIPRSLASGDFAGNDAAIKSRRESVVRALADVSNTRTWNLLVDLVMQSGRYATGATTVDRFSVDGERRYWLHLAIDRYTGQVVARSMEPVNE
jgi:hypothetical protein